MAQTLYRKYRSPDFESVYDQDHITTTLKNAITRDNIAHAYLFCGPRGTGKTSAARILAKAINCTDRIEDGNPCNKCDLCNQTSEGRMVDLIEIDAASNRGIDEIRDLREKIKFSPNIAGKKVYIIDEVHMLTKEAFNALLKTLEEPPAHAHFILATTEPHKVPETIISRCQRFDFKRISVKHIVSRLGFIAQKENIKYDIEALDTIAKHAEGGMRDAISLFEQFASGGTVTNEYVTDNLGLVDETTLHDLYSFIKEKDIPKAMERIQKLYDAGTNFLQFVKQFIEFLRMRMIKALNKNEIEKVQNIMKIIQEFEKAEQGLKFASIIQLPLEIAVINLCISLENFEDEIEKA